MILLLQFIVLQVIVFSAVIFFLKKIFSSDTQGAINRLEVVYQDLLNKQKELTQKIEATEKEFQEKKAEAAKVGEKMKSEAQDEMRNKRDDMMKQAKAQAEEILTKARQSTEEFTRKIEQDVARKMIDTAASILTNALTPELLLLLHDEMIKDFLTRGKDFDLSSVGTHVDKVIVKTPHPLSKEVVEKISVLVNAKLRRQIQVEEVVDKAFAAGILMEFGTLLVDGTLTNFIREAAEQEKKNLQFQK